MAFYNQHDDQSNFALHTLRTPRNEFAVFAKGYAMAADRLANALLKAPRFSEYEAYPVVFLYRHALELSLKHFVYQSVMALVLREVDEVEDWLQRTHKLMPLVRTADRLLSRLFPDDAGLKIVRENLVLTCEEFADIEPAPDSYRYPVDAKWNPPSKKARMVNLRSLHSHMSSVLKECDTIDFGLNLTVDSAAEEFEVIQFVRRLLVEDNARDSF